MRFSRSSLWTVSLCSLVLLAGCGKSSKTEAKPAKSGGGEVDAHHGPHGGMMFDVGPGHKILGELVISDTPRKLELYLVDHSDTKKAVMSGSKAVTITGIKADGKAVADITLAMDPLKTDKDGSSHFVASGDTVPKEIAEDHDLIGAKFKIFIDGKEHEVTIAEH